ncbi:uncharacterized protein LOC132757830 isoform X2 [Ruditapes philippinarum]|uniref:uncharacterized protein LOC132757830 isoform X2 n=1 Tax=Ruditapes philippinarum TaxID=129788 RepID=UPI00295B7FA0|nr:uncharacterized protein LOC132757830 isoform X2 [Ruditapes philippinarum]
MRLCTIVVLSSFVVSSLCQTLEQEVCTSDLSKADINFINADVILGGIFNLRGEGKNDYGCGSPRPEEMLSYEAARWTINRINTNNYIPGIRMGMRAYDVCRSPHQAIAAVNDFYQQYSHSSMYCNSTSKYNLGILGGFTSDTTIPVAALTAKFPASVISPIAGAPELSDKSRFPYFMRTGMSSAEQIRAMIEGMKVMEWERIVVVYSDDLYGTSAMNEMLRRSQTENVCVVKSFAVPKSSSMADYLEKLEDIGMYDVSGGVIFADHETTEMALEAIDQVPGASGIQWMVSQINLNAQTYSGRMRGAIFVQPKITEVTEFFDYFTNIDENVQSAENPWFRDWFMSLFQCRLQGVNYAPYNGLSDCTSKTAQQKRLAINTRYSAVDSVIKAVYAFARALKTAHSQTCGSTPGMCLGLRQMTPQQFQGYLSEVNLDLNDVNIASLRGMRVKFDSNGDFYTSGHTYWNYNNQPSGFYAFKNVGTFVDNVFNLNAANVFMYNNDRSSPLTALPSSKCPTAGCRNCEVHRPMVHFTYAPGDVVLGGLFDIHAKGSEVLLCGALKPTHALNVAAFRYAIRQAKQVFPGILNGVDLGSLIVDLCDSEETGRLLLNNILGGRHVVANVDPNLMKTVVGELDSTEAISMASMLSRYEMPYIESSATSVTLNDMGLFPTFTRAIPSDYKQMLALVLLLKRMDWTYVQVIYSGDAYGISGYETMKKEGAKQSICIAANHEIGKDGSIDAIIGRLNEKPAARAVIAIVDIGDYREILRTIKDKNLQGQFVLIGTEAWGRRESIVTGYEDVAEGSITLDITAPEISKFRQWLSTLKPTDPETMREMPFLAEWYQYAFSCYLDAKNRGTYTVECNPDLPLTSAPRFEVSSYTPFMIAATYAAARAVDETIRDFCGDGSRNYNGLCWQFRSNPDVKEKILQYLRSSEYQLNGYQFKMMMGEGQANYEFYSYTGGEYVRIGTYDTDDSSLQLDFVNPISLPNGFMSSCVSRCGECVYLVQNNPFVLINDDADLRIGVNFALKDPGPDPFLCEALRLTNGMQSYLAVAFALDEVNGGRSPFVLNDVKVGGLLIDHCNSAARAYGIPSALYSGILGDSEPRPNLNAIRAWLTDNSMVTQEMKDFFSDFNLPVISSMATTNSFLDDDEYPTFLRTIQGDSTIASALAILAKSLGLQYVSVLYSSDSFGHGGFDVFSSVAMQEGICIIKAIEMDDSNVDAIVQELIEQSTHAVITYLGLKDMDSFLEARGKNTKGDNLVVISPEPYPMVFNRRGMDARNVLALRMKSNNLDLFNQYLASLDETSFSDDHPYLRAYYMHLFQCNLPGEYRYSSDCGAIRDITTSTSFYDDNYVLPIINAVFAFSGAAHETLKVQCGENYNGVCAKFYSDPETNTILLRKMREVSFMDVSASPFSFIGKEGSTGREIIHFDGSQMKKVADFAGASLNIIDRNLRTMFDNTKSACISPCTECIQNNMNFTYTPGDVMVAGLFDVHQASLTPFSCGDINTIRGFQLLEAFHFAINKVNDKSGQFANVLKNVKLGGIGLDACQSAVKGGYLVSNIHNGISVLQRDGNIINPDGIEAYIAAYSSDRSIYLARLLKTLKIPQISYGSSSISLLDQDRYPFFLRTVPADDRQAMGIMKFLRNYDIRYVQIVHTSDNYGEQAAKILNQLAEEQKVCVAQTVAFLPQSSVTVENANDVVLSLLKKPVANTVIVFADISFINELLQAVRRNPDARGKFKFIGSDTWANNHESIEGVEDIALHSVTLDLDVVDIREFDEYLSTKTPANYPENPWFPEYYEEIQNCYLTIPDTRYPGRCSATPKNIVTSRRYKQDTALIHVINAVYSAAYGLDLALREDCGEDYTNVCEAFKNRDGRHEFVLDKIKQASFVDLSGQPFSFSDRGDGSKGYVLYSIDSSNDLGFTYSPIAKYTSDGELMMTRMSYKPAWDGSCERVDSCTECPTIRNLQTRYMLPRHNDKANNPNPATLIYAARIHDQGNDEYRCGAMNMESTMQALSILYTVHYSNLIINKPFDLRLLILDHCNNQLRIDQDIFNLLTTGNLCNAEFDSDGSLINKDTVMGVQVQSSRYVVAANRVTAPVKIQLMSGTASSTALSDQWRYPYFARTVPPDNIQMEVIAKILKHNGWSYVGVIYAKDSYGINGYKDLQSIVNDGQYSCIGTAEGINSPSTVAELRPIVKRLAETKGIGVIVLIVLDPRPILDALIAEGIAENYLLIGTDTWGVRSFITEDIAKQFAGAITIDFRNAFYNNFVNWTKTISFSNKMGLPDDWFEEFYQHIHECLLPNSKLQMPDYRLCSGPDGKGETITEDKIKQFAPRLTNIAATYAMGNGLNKLYRDYGCADKTFTSCMAGIKEARDVLFENTLAQTWSINAGQVDPREAFNLELGEDRYWNIGYNIYSFGQDNEYYKIGSNSERGGFRFNQAGNYDSQHTGITSECPTDQYCDCAIQDGRTEQQTQPKYMRDHEPRNYFMYDEDTLEQVYQWPIWAIATAVLSCIGLVVGLVLFFYFIICYPVRGGTTILGFLMMLGLFGIYATNFAFFKPAAEDICAARKFLMGVVYTVVFAPLFVKAVDNWRFKDSEFSPKRYAGLTSPISLVLIALGIILIQCIIPIEWLILRRPTASLMADSTDQHDWMWCDPHDFYDISMVLSMSFVVFLVILTAIFAALAWDSESNYFESRWIFVSCVCTAGCLMVWMVVTTNAGPPYRDPAVAIANFVNATALLIFIPIRKLILLVQFSAEEEEAKMPMPSDEHDPNNEIYSTVYTNQMYQPDVFQAESTKQDSDGGY